MYSILLMRNCSRNYFSIDVIMELVSKTAFNWKWFIKKLQKKKLYARQQLQHCVYIIYLFFFLLLYNFINWPFYRSFFWVHVQEWRLSHVDHIEDDLHVPSFARCLWLENQRNALLSHHNTLFPAACHKNPISIT